MITFQNIGLNEDILKALDGMGFKEPTEIQAKAIPHLLSSKKDLIALAQTGTGKTAAFSLPVIEQVNPHSKKLQALILCPTRELCMQTAKNITAFTKYCNGIAITAAYGGARIDQQIRELRRGSQIVVGTPGRVLDLIKRKQLDVETIEFVVLDEADEMLNMGFKEELDGILEGTPDSKQTLLFSATMSSSVMNIASKYMKKPEQITAGKKNIGADKVDHLYYMVHSRDRYQALRRIADTTPDMYAIVFCRTRRETQEVTDSLIQDHYNAEAIHGDLSQQQRSNVMERFRKKKIMILVATDVAARGIDVDDLTHVINYQLPDSLDAYIHRSGRTGRAQKSGTSISIIHMKETGRIKSIEKKVGKEFIKAKVPLGSDVCKSQLLSLINKVKEVEVNEQQIEPYLAEITEQLKDLERDELIKKFVSTEFNRFLAAYKNAPDLNTTVRERTPMVYKENISFTTMTLNLGKKDAFGLKRIFSLINTFSKLRGIEIGHIDIKDNYSILEVDSDRARDFIDCLNGENVRGKTLSVESTTEKPQRSFQRRERQQGASRSNRGEGRGFKKKSYSGKRGDNKGFGNKRKKKKW